MNLFMKKANVSWYCNINTNILYQSRAIYFFTKLRIKMQKGSLLKVKTIILGF